MSDITTNRSLANLCFDLLEIDWDAPENKEYIDVTLNKLTEKVDSYAGLKKYSESQIEFLKKEKVFITSRIKSFEVLIARLRNQAQFSLEALNTDKLKGDLGHSIARRESTSLDITDESLIPDFYLVTKKSPNKKLIKQALEDGKQVPGCEMINTTVVTIK